MIKVLRSTLLALSLVLVSVSALASNLNPEQAQKFISVSGLGDAIDAMPDLFRQQFNIKALVVEDKRTVEEVSKAIQEAVNSTNGYQIAENYLLSADIPGDLNKAIAFLETPLGQQIRAAEDEALKPEYMAEMQAYTAELGQNPPAETRSSLINELVSSLKVEETMVNMIKTMLFSTGDAMAKLEPELVDVVKKELEKEWQNMEPALRPQMMQYAVFSSYYSYRNLTDEQLRTYIDFLKTSDGQIYWAASIEIFQRYVNEILNSMIQNIFESKANS